MKNIGGASDHPRPPCFPPLFPSNHGLVVGQYYNAEYDKHNGNKGQEAHYECSRHDGDKVLVDITNMVLSWHDEYSGQWQFDIRTIIRSYWGIATPQTSHNTT